MGGTVMKRGTILLILVAATFALTLSLTAPAQAASRTWVSGVGSDGNPCTRTAPCLTFGHAYALTDAGGEINCLDPGSFVGGLLILKSITISCETGTAGILVGSDIGFLVQTAATDTVYLRGLDIEHGAALGNEPPTGI